MVNLRDNLFRSLVKYTRHMSRVNSAIGTNIGALETPLEPTPTPKFKGQLWDKISLKQTRN